MQYEPNQTCKDTKWLDITVQGKSLRLGCIYRSPNNNQRDNQTLLEHIEHVARITPDHTELLIVGDFNLEKVDWKTLQSRNPPTHHSSVFLELFLDLHLTQHVEKPTRFRAGQQPTLDDLILSKGEDMVNEIEHYAGLGLSDHCLLVTSLNLLADEHQVATDKILNYHRANFEAMKAEIRNANLCERLQDKNVQDMWNVIKEEIKTTVNRHVPEVKLTRTQMRRTKPLWLNDKALKKVKLKHAAFKRYMQTREGEDFQNYVNARRESKRETRRAMREYEWRISFDARRAPKKFWGHVKRRTKPRPKIPALKVGGKLVCDDKTKVETFNSYFASVFTVEDKTNIPPPGDPPDANTRMRDITFTVDEVKKALGNLKPDKSPGPDGISPRILKELRSELAPACTTLFQKSYDTGEVPQDWKLAHVCPIHKKADKSSPENYRPVSLTCVLSKVMETVIREHVMKYLSENNIISSSQYGFVPGKSTVTNLIKCTEKWSEILDRRKCVDVVYFDFRKAFDSVPHQRLIQKLRSAGLSPRTVTWIGDFLVNRKQAVKIGNTISMERNVISGVPQGSVIGPTLFLLFINDLPECVQNENILFADDLKLYKEIALIADCMHLQSDINALYLWSKRWQLDFNANKCVVLRLGNNPPPFQYKMGDQILQQVTDAKDLGVTIKDDLSTSAHIADITAKATRISFTIKRVFRYLTPRSGVQIYKALVRPILEYASSAWAPILKRDMDALEKVQRRFTKFISGLGNMSYQDRLKELNLFSIKHRRKRGDQIEMFKIVHYTDLADHLLVRPHRGTRGHNYKLQITRSSTTVRQNQLFNRAALTWNSLPEYLVNAKDVDCFKRGLDMLWRDDPSVYLP